MSNFDLTFQENKLCTVVLHCVCVLVLWGVQEVINCLCGLSRQEWCSLMMKIMYKVVREVAVMFLRHLNLEAQGGSQNSLRKV